jgi:hypothetical protein
MKLIPRRRLHAEMACFRPDPADDAWQPFTLRQMLTIAVLAAGAWGVFLGLAALVVRAITGEWL